MPPIIRRATIFFKSKPLLSYNGHDAHVLSPFAIPFELVHCLAGQFGHEGKKLGMEYGPVMTREIRPQMFHTWALINIKVGHPTRDGSLWTPTTSIPIHWSGFEDYNDNED
jgi:hypothetical protein